MEQQRAWCVCVLSYVVEPACLDPYPYPPHPTNMYMIGLAYAGLPTKPSSTLPLHPPFGGMQGCTGPFFFLRVSRSRVNSAPGQAQPAPEQASPGSPTSPGYPEASKKISGFKSHFFFALRAEIRLCGGREGRGRQPIFV